MAEQRDIGRAACAVVLAVKAKLTTPLVMPVIVSQDESLTGANGPVRLAVAGNTTGKTSLPGAGVSVLAVGSTKAWGSSLSRW